MGCDEQEANARHGRIPQLNQRQTAADSVRGIATTPKWSTLTLLSVGVALGGFGYLAGRIAPARDLPTQSALPSARSRAPTQNITNEGRVVASHRSPATSASLATGVSADSVEALILLATRNPAAALAQADRETNWRQRTLRRNAVIRGWASAAPREAATFLSTLSDTDRPEAAVSFFAGASAQPEVATAIARELCMREPQLADDYGRALITALSEVGEWQSLIKFATSDPLSHASDWLGATFSQWAARDPEQAKTAMMALANPDAQQAAFRGLIFGWSMAEPPALAQYALQLPAGENRIFALRQALTEWQRTEPDAVARWMLQFDPGPEFDLSAATLATSPALLAGSPNAALGWAQGILEPCLRESTLTALGRAWAERDSARASWLVATATGLTAADRDALVAGLNLAANPPAPEGGP